MSEHTHIQTRKLSRFYSTHTHTDTRTVPYRNARNGIASHHLSAHTYTDPCTYIHTHTHAYMLGRARARSATSFVQPYSHVNHQFRRRQIGQSASGGGGGPRGRLPVAGAKVCLNMCVCVCERLVRHRGLHHAATTTSEKRTENPHRMWNVCMRGPRRHGVADVCFGCAFTFTHTRTHSAKCEIMMAFSDAFDALVCVCVRIGTHECVFVPKCRHQRWKDASSSSSTVKPREHKYKMVCEIQLRTHASTQNQCRSGHV